MSTTEATLQRAAHRLGLVLRIDTHNNQHRARLVNDSGNVEYTALTRQELMDKLAKVLK